MCILNGRLCPEQDDFTCKTGRGMSVVDYIIVSQSMYEQCRSFSVVTCHSMVEQYNLQHFVGERSKVPDHSALLLSVKSLDIKCLETNMNESLTIPSLPKKYNCKQIPTNFMSNNEVCQSLENIYRNISTESVCTLEKLYNAFVNIIKNEMDVKLPCIKIETNRNILKDSKTITPFWNEELQLLHTEMRQKEKNLKNTKRHLEKHEKWTQFRDSQNKFDRRFRFYKRQHERGKMAKIDQICTSNPTEFWHKIKSLGPKKKYIIPMEIINNDGTLETNSTVVLNQWKNEFCNLYKNILGVYDDDFKEISKHFMLFNEDKMTNPLYEETGNLNINFSYEEVQYVVLKAKNGKSTGMDGIPYEVLKNKCCIEFLQRLFQYCFDIAHTPKSWHEAIITPVPKSRTSDPRVPLNYRGISLLSTCAKLYSSILNNRLVAYLETNDLIADEQNGFRSDRSCLDHIFAITTLIRNRLLSNMDTFTCFIDLRKAFDFVDRDLLFAKLIKLNITGKIYFAIKEMLSETKSCIKINQLCSDYFSISNGVRQGDPISSTLFSIFINDLVYEIKTLNYGIKLEDQNVSILLYADDLVLIATNEYELQEMIETLYLWTKKWRISINSEKSNIMHFRTARKRQTEFKFKLGNNCFNNNKFI